MSESKAEQRYTLKEVPVGTPTAAHFDLQTITAPTAAELKDGEVLLRPLFISVDPYLRGRMYSAKAGDPMVSGTVARVVASKASNIAEGVVVHGYMPWATVLKTEAKGLRVVDEALAPVSTANGVLGMPGMTAYFGLLEVCALKAGDNVLVSGAAGAVGSVVVQIAKLKGCRVVGVAGSTAKCEHVTADLGADVAINYKDHADAKSAQTALRAAFPEGIDVYFDNTGGIITDATWELINTGARIGICGQISLYNKFHEAPQGPRFLHHLIYKGATVRGFVVSQFQDRAAEFFRDVAGWVKGGQIKYRETVMNGFDQLPAAFIGLFTGKNLGKMLVKL